MNYVLTTHHLSENNFFSVQSHKIRNNINNSYIIAIVDNLYKDEAHKYFDLVISFDDLDARIKKSKFSEQHSYQLEYLASYVLHNSNDENNIMIFLDCDSFPINPINKHISDLLDDKI